MRKHPKNYWLMWLAAIVLAACHAKPIRIADGQVCIPGGSDSETCLPIDNRNAAIIAHHDGEPVLIPMPAADVVEADSLGFEPIMADLVESGRAWRYHPDSVAFDYHHGGLTIRQTFGSNTPLLYLNKAELDSVTLITAPAEGGYVLAIAHPIRSTVVELTDSILQVVKDSASYLSSPCYEYLERVGEGGVGIVVVLDEGSFGVSRGIRFGPQARGIRALLDGLYLAQLMNTSITGLEFRGTKGHVDDHSPVFKTSAKTVVDGGIPNCNFDCSRRTMATFPMSGVRIFRQTEYMSGKVEITYLFVQGADIIYSLSPTTFCHDIYFEPSRSPTCFDVNVCQDCRTSSPSGVNFCSTPPQPDAPQRYRVGIKGL